MAVRLAPTEEVVVGNLRRGATPESLQNWQHLTGTFIYGNGPTKEELDEIIRRSLALWAKAG
jgi:hypothetical protein